MIGVTEALGGVVFAVRVIPRASRNSIDGEYQGALKLRVIAPPLDGRANLAVCSLLSERLKVPLSAVKILSGQKSRNKRVQIFGVRPQQAVKLLP